MMQFHNTKLISQLLLCLASGLQFVSLQVVYWLIVTTLCLLYFLVIWPLVCMWQGVQVLVSTLAEYVESTLR